MVLLEVKTKKLFTYEYESKDEMNEHIELMAKAKFKLEHSDDYNYYAIFSQTIK